MVLQDTGVTGGAQTALENSAGIGFYVEMMHRPRAQPMAHSTHSPVLLVDIQRTHPTHQITLPSLQEPPSSTAGTPLYSLSGSKFRRQQLSCLASFQIQLSLVQDTGKI